MFNHLNFLVLIFFSFIVHPAACPPAQAQAQAQAQATQAQWHEGGESEKAEARRLLNPDLPVRLALAARAVHWDVRIEFIMINIQSMLLL